MPRAGFPPSAAHQTVLIVEPHLDTAEMYAEFFRYSGLNTITASNASDAVHATENATVVVTNLSLPGRVDGLDLVTRLRRTRRTQHVPVVVMSAGLEAKDRALAQKAGCDLFLSKPCLPDTLLRSVRRLLSHPIRRG